MKTVTPYHGRRFPAGVISTAVWLYHRFALSFRDVDGFMAHPGVIESYDSIRRCCLKLGPQNQRVLTRREEKGADQWYAHEIFIRINGEHLYLWRPVDQDEDVLDVLVQRNTQGGGWR